MQAPRNWRMKNERYRLIGSEDENGNRSIVQRPESLAKHTQDKNQTQPQLLNVTAA